MQPPIPLGTCLQNRYRLTQILGQGGFGRTYLAEDQGRFNEWCAIKEWIPPQSTTESLAKSQELFQREAAILYQIQHPQIPQFRAFFEQDGRLFLVQDYVAGKTYRNLLEERQRQHILFSEAEVRGLIEQLLPVLDYLHQRGIIHRDISPENIILRDQDQLPVLIDFGVVKELATRLQSGNCAPTTVGKLGYAPSEQMQTGRAYPSSDLYALAVTAIVLLTGREPQELFDDRTLTWQWQALVSVRPSFGHVINRMLSPKPRDRYASAAEVADALQTLSAAAYRPVVQRQATVDHLSHLQTVAVAKRPSTRPTSPSAPRSPSRIVEPPTLPRTRSLWDNPWVLMPMGLFVALISGFGAWVVVNTWLNTPALLSRPGAPASPMPTPTVVPTPLLSPKPAIPQAVQRRPLPLVTDQPLFREGTVTAPLIYLFAAEKGQRLSVKLEGTSVQMTLLGPNQEPTSRAATEVKQWEGTLPQSGEYGLRISPAGNATESDYQLEVHLTNPPVEPSPTPSPPERPTVSETLLPIPQPSPSPETQTNPPLNPPLLTPNPGPIEVPDSSPNPPLDPKSEVESVVFPNAKRSLKLTGQTSAQGLKRYLVNGQANQRLRVEVLEGPVTLEILDPNGQILSAGGLDWENSLPLAGTYEVRVVADASTPFTLKIRMND